MRTVDRSAIVSCSPKEMFALVADVEAYPEFLPGCEAALLRSKSDTELVATLTLGFGGLSSTFTTRNRLDPPGAMGLELVDGPFRVLRGGWTFDAAGQSPADLANSKGCRLALKLQFEFSNPAKDLLLGSIFESTCNMLVEAFVSRARSIYG